MVVTCVYRSPGSSVEAFTDNMEEILEYLNEKKTFIMCGDFNIDLLNMSKSSSHYLDTIYSKGLHPLITRPTRITIDSATLIDNIFTNIRDDKVKYGILINDISDHLPIFVSYHHYYIKPKHQSHQLAIRLCTEDSVNRFRTDLLEERWEEVYVENVNVAFNRFLQKYKLLYEKNCPMTLKREKINSKPWLTKGLQKEK